MGRETLKGQFKPVAERVAFVFIADVHSILEVCEEVGVLLSEFEVGQSFFRNFTSDFVVERSDFFFFCGPSSERYVQLKVLNLLEELSTGR